MKIPTTCSLIISLASLAGCASYSYTAIPMPPPTDQAEVVVFREPSFIAAGVSLTVGTGSSAFAYIWNSEYVSVNLPTGEQEIFVQASIANPTRVRLTLQPESRICLRTVASPSTLAKVLVPVILMATGYGFFLDEVPCPSAEDLAKFKQVTVNYAVN
jgi:H+/gluconate symporter-like permease